MQMFGFRSRLILKGWVPWLGLVALAVACGDDATPQAGGESEAPSSIIAESSAATAQSPYGRAARSGAPRDALVPDSGLGAHASLLFLRPRSKESQAPAATAAALDAADAEQALPPSPARAIPFSDM